MLVKENLFVGDLAFGIAIMNIDNGEIGFFRIGEPSKTKVQVWASLDDLKAAVQEAHKKTSHVHADGTG